MNEIWKAVPGFEGLYEVSNLGRLRTVAGFRLWHSSTGTPFQRFVPARIHKPQKHSGGYLQYSLQGRTYLAHDLVTQAFLGPRPEGKEVCHRDDNKRNTRLDNLRYGTHIENCVDRLNNGVVVKGVLNPRAKIRDADVKSIRDLAATMYQKDVGVIFGISQTQISRIVNKKHWPHV